MASASDRVWGTYELLEMILLELPPKLLFVIQRVCKTWRDLIGNSQKIRQLCFLTPRGNPVLPAPSGEYSNIIFTLNRFFSFRTTRSRTYKCSQLSYDFRDHEEMLVKSTYRDMLLTQPPVTAVSVAAEITRHKTFQRLVSTASGVKGVWDRKPFRRMVTGFGLYRNENGVRLRELQDWAAECLYEANGELEENVTVVIDVTIDTKFVKAKGD